MHVDTQRQHAVGDMHKTMSDDAKLRDAVANVNSEVPENSSLAHDDFGDELPADYRV